MASIVVAGDTSGTVTLTAPAVAGTTTLTLPTTSGTVVTGTTPSGTIVGTTDTQTLTNKTLTSPTITGATITVASTAAPAFSAYANTVTTASNTTWTKVIYDVELFDTNNNFSSNRFTPTIAGYYQINATYSIASTMTSNNNAFSIWKLGVEYIRGSGSSISGGYWYAQVSGIMYFNGSSDYIEIYVFQSSGGSITSQTGTICNFNAAMIRSA